MQKCGGWLSLWAKVNVRSPESDANLDSQFYPFSHIFIITDDFSFSLSTKPFALQIF